MTEKREFIPLFDLDIGEAEIEGVTAVLRSKWLTMGEVAGRFEAEFAEYVGAPFCLAVSNGTAALHLALLACGIGPGDEVICPSLTFVATANAVLYTGATPVFADITGMSDLNVSPRSIARKISDRTRAVLVVHYAGYPCDMKAIMDLAAANGLKVVDDSAHAPGAAFVWRDGTVKEVRVQKAGTIGDAGCFSFFSNKNLAVGEGGALVVRDAARADRARLLRSHGMTHQTLDRHRGHAFSYDVTEAGFNYRWDEFRAAVATRRLARLPTALERRTALAGAYRQALAAAAPDVIVPFAEGYETVPAHIFPVLLPRGVRREEAMETLRARGIQTSIHYPLIPAFQGYGRDSRGEWSVAEQYCARVLTLPFFPEMTAGDASRVAKELGRCCRS